MFSDQFGPNWETSRIRFHFRVARFHSNVRWWVLLHLTIDYKMTVLHAPCEDEVPSMVCPLGGSVSTVLVRFSASRCDPRRGSKRHKVRFIARHCKTGACSLQVSEGPSQQAFSNGSGSTRSRFEVMGLVRKPWVLSPKIESLTIEIVRAWMNDGKVIMVLASAGFFPIRHAAYSRVHHVCDVNLVRGRCLSRNSQGLPQLFPRVRGC